MSLPHLPPLPPSPFGIPGMRPWDAALGQGMKVLLSRLVLSCPQPARVTHAHRHPFLLTFIPLFILTPLHSPSSLCSPPSLSTHLHCLLHAIMPCLTSSSSSSFPSSHLHPPPNTFIPLLILSLTHTLSSLHPTNLQIPHFSQTPTPGCPGWGFQPTLLGFPKGIQPGSRPWSLPLSELIGGNVLSHSRLITYKSLATTQPDHQELQPQKGQNPESPWPLGQHTPQACATVPKTPRDKCG